MQTKQNGVALILVTGILTLLAVFAAALANGTLMATASDRARAGRGQARILAGSGLDYATARLWQGGLRYPDSQRSLENRGDDFFWREESRGTHPSLSPAAALNPSYAHGDLWNDGGGTIPGVYDDPQNEPIASDLDRDGRFDSWSGRLRGGAPFSFLFSLKIRSTAGLINVNSGELGDPLGDQDMDGLLNADDTTAVTPITGQYLYETDLDWNGVEDWCDTDEYLGLNRHLAYTLDNLGAILGVSTKATRPYQQGAGGRINHMILFETSDLGERIVANRPRGGYGSIQELRAILGPADYDLVAPFLTVRGDAAVTAFSGDEGHGLASDWENPEEWIGSVSDVPPYDLRALVDLNEAPPAVLEATLRYLAVSGSHHLVSASPPNTYQLETPYIRMMLTDPADHEAGRMAREIERERRLVGPLYDWGSLFSAVCSVSAPLEDDRYTRSPVDEASDDLLRALKQDLVLANADPNGFMTDLLHARATLDLPRPIGGRTAPWPRRAQTSHMTLVTTAPYDEDGRVAPPVDGGVPPRPFDDQPAGTRRMTLPYALGKTGYEGYIVTSEGWTPTQGGNAAAVVETELFWGKNLSLTGQQDFDPLADYSDPGSARDAWAFAGGDVACHDLQTNIPLRQGTQTWPCFSRRSWIGNASLREDATFKYPRVIGGVALEARQWTDAELTGDFPSVGGIDPDATCVFALPFNEDRAGYSDLTEADNMGDPLAGARTPPSPMGLCDSEGMRLSPCGPRLVRLPPLSTGGYCDWNGGSPFPLPRGTMSGKPSEILQGTITCRFPAHGGSDRLPGVPRSWSLLFSRTRIGMSPYVRLSFRAGPSGNQVQLEENDGSDSWIPAGPALDVPVLNAGLPWHHVAAVFRDDGDPSNGRTAVQVYIDGNAVGVPVTIASIQAPPWSGSMSLGLEGPIDDLFMFLESLDGPAAVKLLGQARLDRFVRQGGYTSPRYRFDLQRLPEGAVVTGFGWDAIIPASRGGSISFTLTALLTDGVTTVTRSAHYGSGPQWVSFEPIPGCREVWFEARFNDPTTGLHVFDSNGAGGPPVVMDTPYLDEFRIFYTPERRPAMTGYSLR